MDRAGVEMFYEDHTPRSAPIPLIVVLSVLNAFKVFREAYLVAGDYPQEKKMYLLQHLFNNWYRGAVAG